MKVRDIPAIEAMHFMDRNYSAVMDTEIPVATPFLTTEYIQQRILGEIDQLLSGAGMVRGQKKSLAILHLTHALKVLRGER